MSRVQSIERAFAVLGALAEGPVGVTDVADRVELPKSTVARLLASLAREGAVEQVPGGTDYRLGSRIAALAAGADPIRGLIAVAHPALAELVASIGESAGLSVLEDGMIHCVDQVDTIHEVQVRDWTGTRAPVHAVPSGHVVLASLAAADLEAYLARPRDRLTSRTLVSSDALRDRLVEVRRRGYAWVLDEFADGLTSVAAGVANERGAVVAAIHVHGPSYRFPGGRDERTIGEEVARVAGRVAARLQRGT